LSRQYQWKEGKVEGWQKKASAATSQTHTNGDAAPSEEGIWCAACKSIHRRLWLIAQRRTDPQAKSNMPRKRYTTRISLPKSISRLQKSYPRKQRSGVGFAGRCVRLHGRRRWPGRLRRCGFFAQNIERKSALTAREREQEVEEAMEETQVVTEEVEPEEDDGRISSLFRLGMCLPSHINIVRADFAFILDSQTMQLV
jgi:hypothetical protein